MTNKPNVMAEDSAPQEGAEPTPETPNKDQQQTVEIPLSACPTPPKPGQMLNFKVISVDQGAGVVNAVCTDYGGAEGEEGEGGSDSLAKEFEPRPTPAAVQRA